MSAAARPAAVLPPRWLQAPGQAASVDPPRSRGRAGGHARDGCGTGDALTDLAASDRGSALDALKT